MRRQLLVEWWKQRGSELSVSQKASLRRRYPLGALIRFKKEDAFHRKRDFLNILPHNNEKLIPIRYSFDATLSAARSHFAKLDTFSCSKLSFWRGN